MSALDQIDAAFGSIAKPEHFTDYLLCPECEDHDNLLRQRDRNTLTLGDVENPSWTPVPFMSAEGLAYYIPALARFALSQPTAEGWYGYWFAWILRYKGHYNELLQYCDYRQRDAIAYLLMEMIELGAALEERVDKLELIKQAVELWRI